MTTLHLTTNAEFEAYELRNDYTIHGTKLSMGTAQCNVTVSTNKTFLSLFRVVVVKFDTMIEANKSRILRRRYNLSYMAIYIV